MAWAWLFGGLKTPKSIAAGLLIAAALSTQAPCAGIGRIKTVVGQASVVRGPATLPATPGQTISVKDVLTPGPDARQHRRVEITIR